MTRLDILSALAQRTGLLRADQDDDQRLANAIAFTHLAAWELRDQGFAAVKSTEPNDVHGIKAGFLVGRETREHLRIIANLETPQQVVVWEELPLAGKDVVYAAPVDPNTNPAIQGALAGDSGSRGSRSSKSAGHKSNEAKPAGAHA